MLANERNLPKEEVKSWCVWWLCFEIVVLMEAAR